MIKMASLLDISPDNILQILPMLDIRDIISVMQTYNQHLYSICISKILWQKLIQQHYWMTYNGDHPLEIYITFYNTKTKKKQKLFKSVINTGKKDAIQLLLDHLTRFNKRKCNAIFIDIAQQNDINTLKILLTCDKMDHRISRGFKHHNMAALHCAIEKQHNDFVTILLNHISQPINPLDVLYSAVKYGNYQLVKLLVENYDVTNLNCPTIVHSITQSKDDISPEQYDILELVLSIKPYHKDLIIHAIENNDMRLMDIVLRNPEMHKLIDFDRANQKAIASNNVFLVKKMLVHNPPDYIYDVNSAMTCAIQYDNSDLIELFIDSPDLDPLSSDMAMIKHAIFQANETVLMKLIQNIPPNTYHRILNYASTYIKNGILHKLYAMWRFDKKELFLEAIQLVGYKNEYITFLLQDSDIDPAMDDNRAIRFCVKANNYPLTKLLLSDPRVDPSVRDNCCLVTVVENNSIRIMEMLIKHPKIDPSFNNNCVFIHGVSHGNVSLVKELLLDKRVNPSVNNNLCLIHAIKNNDTSMMKLLLQNNRIDPTINNNIVTTIALTHVIALFELFKQQKISTNVFDSAIYNLYLLYNHMGVNISLSEPVKCQIKKLLCAVEQYYKKLKK